MPNFTPKWACLGPNPSSKTWTRFGSTSLLPPGPRAKHTYSSCALHPLLLDYLRTNPTSGSLLTQKDWDTLILAYAFVSVCMYQSSHSFLEKHLLDAWRAVHLQLFSALRDKSKQESITACWSNVLLWRMTLDYVAITYNRYWHRGQLACPEHRNELLEFHERT